MKGTKKQKEAYKYLTDSKTKTIVYGGAAGGGKSFLGCFWLFTMADNYPNTRWFIGREELKRIRQSTYITWVKVCNSLNGGQPAKDVLYTTNMQDNYIHLTNGSRIDMLDLRLTPSDPMYERFGSVEYTGGWIEEGGETDFGAFDILKTRTGRHMNKEYGLKPKILITCNPKKNWLYTDYYLPHKQGKLRDDEVFIQAFVQDNPHLPEDYIQNLRETKDKAKKERLLFGNWEYDDDPNALIEYDNILAMFNNIQVEEGSERYITADIARMGSDKAVIMVWYGYRMIEIVEFDKSLITDIQNAINTLRVKHNIKANNVIADEDGVGGGVVDNCKIKGFVNNSKALNDENYKNLKTQCYYKLAEKINDAGIYITAELSEEQKKSIVEELECVKSYQTDNDTKLSILPKQQVKELIKRSPDYSDAMAMRVWFDLVPQRRIKSFGAY